MPSPRRLLFALAIAAMMLACTISIGGPSYPSERIPVSTAAIEELQTAIATALASGATSGEVTLFISEAQLTSYLAYSLQNQPQPFITDPQVYLRAGQVQVYGTVQRGYLEATACIILTPTIDSSGHLQLELTSADFGPFPTPKGLREALTAIVSEAYTGALGPAATGFRLESVVIANGYALLTGRIH
jgi:uncharacterized protein YpmS